MGSVTDNLPGNKKSYGADRTNRSSSLPILLIIYLFAKPFYFFPSGGPQIADVFICLAFIAALFSRSPIADGTGKILIVSMMFCFYVFFVNGIWALILSDYDMLKTPGFYTFNAIAMYAVLALLGTRDQRGVQALLLGVAGSLLLQAFLVIVTDLGSDFRNPLFFNNPNQLGYWALLSALIFCILSRSVRVPILYQLAIFIIAFYLIALSNSKAATGSLALLFLIHFSKKWWHLVLGIAFGLVLFLSIQDTQLIENLILRLTSGERDNTILARGYMRIAQYPQYLFFGAGEGGAQRFPGAVLEIHSTLGTVVFSYGLFGSILFGNLIWKLYRGSGFANFLYLAPAFVYGLTHQGLRFTHFWILLAVLVACGHQRNPTRIEQRSKEGQPLR